MTPRADMWQTHTVPGHCCEGPVDRDAGRPDSWKSPPIPAGYKAAGPWEPVAPFPGCGVLWRRPLVKVGGAK